MLRLTPAEFTPAVIRKLAPATAAGLSALAVWRDAEQGLRIHGLQALSSDVTGDDGPPRVEITGRGTLAVFDGQALLGTYWRGAWHPLPEQTGLYTLRGEIQDHLGWNSASGYRKSNCIVRMLKAMLRLGHGGTLAFTPQGSEWKQRLQSEGNEPASSQSALAEALSDYEQALHMGQQDQRWRDAASGLCLRIEGAAERVALLSQIDGALILDRDLKVVTFGAVIRSDGVDGEVEEREWPEGGAKPITKLGGTRHQSAAWFTRCCAGAMAFVVSQDRSVSMFVGQADGLMVYRGLERVLLPQCGGPDASDFWMRQPDNQHAAAGGAS